MIIRKRGGMTSGADAQYQTATLNELKDLPVKERTAADALLFMWVTVPLLDQGLELMSAWGFKYKTLITWEKTGGLGMGHWLRVQTEHIIIGAKGKVKPFKHQEKNIYRLPLCAHSAKPHFFRELVGKLGSKSFDELSKLEMFARSRPGMFSDYEYEGSDVYGNQVNNSIKL